MLKSHLTTFTTKDSNHGQSHAISLTMVSLASKALP